jgi:hypothetical protein
MKGPYKKMGRPRIGNSPVSTVGVNLFKESRKALELLAQERNIKLSVLCREIIEDWLKQSKNND